MRALFGAPEGVGVSTDDLAVAAGASPRELRDALRTLEQAGVAANDTALAVFVHAGGERSSWSRFERAAVAERTLIDGLRDTAPDLEVGETTQINLRLVAQTLRVEDCPEVRPDVVERLLSSLARDGRDEEQGIGSIALLRRRADRERCGFRLQRSWDALARTAEVRRLGAAVLLRALIALLPSGKRGHDLRVETSIGALSEALEADLEVRSAARDAGRLLDRSLLWLHEQEVITLARGLTVFRPAMSIEIKPGRERFTKSDFEPLRLHYDSQVRHVHVMAAYAERALASPEEAERLVTDYFAEPEDAFLDRWGSSS